MVCVIPARGGSKRLTRKNIKEIDGTPVIAYPIRTALDSGLFDQVYVSTDDSEIGLIAKEYGATVLYRPASLCEDGTTDADVVRHLWSIIDGYHLCYIYPTAALVTVDQIKAGLSALHVHRAGMVRLQYEGRDAGVYWYHRYSGPEIAVGVDAGEAQDVDTIDDWQELERKFRGLYG
jgi:CMP-N-acetylneuraminic acid synthetase